MGRTSYNPSWRILCAADDNLGNIEHLVRRSCPTISHFSSWHLTTFLFSCYCISACAVVNTLRCTVYERNEHSQLKHRTSKRCGKEFRPSGEIECSRSCPPISTSGRAVNIRQFRCMSISDCGVTTCGCPPHSLKIRDYVSHALSIHRTVRKSPGEIPWRMVS